MDGDKPFKNEYEPFGFPIGFERVPGYERWGPPVPGEGPILTVLKGPDDIIAARYPNGPGTSGKVWIFRNGATEWEPYDDPARAK